MSSKHGANSWDDYLNVHQRRMADFIGHFIIEDRVGFTRTASQVLWRGEILWAAGIEIHVRKRQDIRYRNGRPWVRTVDYSYQVMRRQARDLTPMFRHDCETRHTTTTRTPTIAINSTRTVARSCRPPMSANRLGPPWAMSSRRPTRAGWRLPKPMFDAWVVPTLTHYPR